ncbi:MAG: tRNA uridine-5-carboxymethylaminomethyl(34) synthesis GTPase MnmE [Vulcanimicrobiaceae bacterium]
MPAFDDGDTVAAIATPPGRGAIAIVRLSGGAANAIAARIFRTPRPLEPRVATLGVVVDAAGAAIDRGLGLAFPAPHSYTGEDVVEVHVHGSPAIARDTLLAALAAGARLATAGEFTRRAYLRGKLDLSAAEAVGDLIAAESRSAARAALARLSGGLAAEVEARRAALDGIAEDLTAALDFPDEVDAPEAAALERRIADVDAALAALAETWEAGLIVREGIAIAIVGPPNAGKSSLLNALLGADRALVSDVPGTTRDTIEETLALGGGLWARVVDTAGLRTSDDALEAAGIARSERALAAATIALVVVDGSQPLGADARAVLGRTRDRERLVFFNKADLGRVAYDERDPAEAAALSGSVRDPAAVSAVRAGLARAARADLIALARPQVGTARQADAVLEARRSLAQARATLASGDPIDLVAPDLAHARAALAEITGRDADETLLAGIFARFCIGK